MSVGFDISAARYSTHLTICQIFSQSILHVLASFYIFILSVEQRLHSPRLCLCRDRHMFPPQSPSRIYIGIMTPA